MLLGQQFNTGQKACLCKCLATSSYHNSKSKCCRQLYIDHYCGLFTSRNNFLLLICLNRSLSRISTVSWQNFSPSKFSPNWQKLENFEKKKTHQVWFICSLAFYKTKTLIFCIHPQGNSNSRYTRKGEKMHSLIQIPAGFFSHLRFLASQHQYILWNKFYNTFPEVTFSYAEEQYYFEFTVHLFGHLKTSCKNSKYFCKLCK